MRPIKRTQGWLPTVFNDFFDTDFLPMTNSTAPAINVKESKTDYTVELAAPGVKKEDFDIQINDEGDLHIKLESSSDKKNEEKECHYLRREFSYAKYEQTLILPEDVDKEKISAKVSDGVLTIDLPKLQPKETPKVGRKVDIL